MEYKIHEIKHSSSNEEFEKIMNIYIMKKLLMNGEKMQLLDQ